MGDWINRFSLDGRTALVTGASKGIGAEICAVYADAGANIIASGRDADGLKEVEAAVTAKGRKCVTIPCELADVADVREMGHAAMAEAGTIDILVNNAGIIRRNDALDFTEEDWDAVMDTNLKSAFFLSQAAARHMKARGRGKIINIASLLSFQGGIRIASYTASKSGLAGLTRLLACEWAPLGINVNAVAPGYVVTNNTEALREDPVRYKAILDRIPAGHWAQPSDIAGAVVYLASDAANYVHGVVLPVDGGWLAR